MKTSYSALETFEVCPLKYKFQEIDKKKGPKRIEQVFGTLVHSALKFMFERNPLYPTLDEILNFYSEKWAITSEKILWKDAETRERAEKVYFEEGRKMLEHFYKKNAPWNFNPVELESRFSIPLLDEETKTEHSVVGILDRLDKNQDGGYEIIDYKTGKKMPSEESLGTNLQLGVYGLAIKHKWPHVESRDIATSLYFLKHNEKISVNLTDEMMERAKRRIITIIREIEKRVATGDFPPTPGPLCSYCAFRSICPMWSHEYKKKEAYTPSDEEAKKAIEEFFTVKKDEAILKKRLAEIRALLLSYMEQEGLGRVFSDTGSIGKTEIVRLSYELEKIEPLLKKAGLWENILSPDEKLLEQALEKLPKDLREEIIKFRTEKKTILLKPSKKRGSTDD